MQSKSQNRLTNISEFPGKLGRFLKDTLIMFFLILVFFLAKLFTFLAKIPVLKIVFSRVADRLEAFMSKSVYSKSSISRLSLIQLAFKNIAGKKSRAMVTVGGMAIGIGTIVFLLSLGYGIQSLVVNQIASLGELRQFDATPRRGSKVVLNDETLAKVYDYNHVEKIYPLIAIVGRVKSNNSYSDVPVYAVKNDYFEGSPTRVESGRFFNADEEKSIDQQSNVKGVEDEASTDASASSTTGKTELELIDIGEPVSTEEEVKEVSVDTKVSHVIVVNQAMLPILGFQDSAAAVGKNVELSFVISANQTDEKVKLISTKMDFKILGVMSDDSTPIMYVPFNDAQNSGVNNFTSFKVGVDTEDNMSIVRKQVENLGFSTNSVLDTIVQVNSIFRSVNAVLAVIGMMALLVASLGMFNTLTVSLLERTREVGLLKTLGMKSREVRDLFLAESLIMGIEGGIIGLIAGTILGKVVGLLVTALFVVNNRGTVLAYVPNELVVFVVVLALVVGLFTGLYPARRAMRISALDALRYE